MRVLIIDDEAQIRSILTVFLETQGHEPWVFADVPSCPLYHSPEPSLCSELEVEALLTDQCLPYMTGLAFIQRQIERGWSLPITNMAVMSGYWTPQTRQWADQLGVRQFAKPFTLQAIQRWLETCQKQMKALHSRGRTERASQLREASQWGGPSQ